MDGIFSINKATGMTSHDVVARMRKLLHQKRVGHAGTLDPAASGVLPICVGQGTRVAEYLSASGKAYQAEVTFGVVTDTYDAEGPIIRTSNIDDLTLDKITAQLKTFLGPQMQFPPRYSAVKLQGQRAYKLARSGAEVTLEARPIEIYELRTLDWQPPRLTLAIECSKGTYIRSLAYDLGERLGCGAHLSTLIRTRSGPFTLANSITLEQLTDALAQGEETPPHLFPPDSALPSCPQLHLDAPTAARVLHGNTFHYDVQSLQPETTLARVYNAENKFIAIATWNAHHQYWQPVKVFN